MVSRRPATMARLVRTPRPSRRAKPSATSEDIRRLMVDADPAMTDHRPTEGGSNPNRDIAASNARSMPPCGDPVSRRRREGAAKLASQGQGTDPETYGGGRPRSAGGLDAEHADEQQLEMIRDIE